MMNNKQIRILFTSVGRRVELMQAYREAANELNANVIIYGADISASAPALFFCDKQVIVKRITDPEYIPQLLKICSDEKIDVLIPTIDTDLLLLAKSKEHFSVIGTQVLISAVDKVQLCRDKRFTADYFMKCGLKSPVPVDDYTKYDGSYPAFIKPKDGSSSIDAYKVCNAEELETYSRMVDDYIIQPFIEGTEYTIDIFCDFDGNPVYITPRERVAVRSGEVLKTRIVQDETMIEECKKLIADYKPCGAITVQLIQQTSTGDNYYIEINPRYGGGAPLSIKAGANSAKALLKIVSGEKQEYFDKAAEDGAVFSRFDQSIRVK
jgi:carbamoyl-phosphate synthase large subunit